MAPNAKKQFSICFACCIIIYVASNDKNAITPAPGRGGGTGRDLKHSHLSGSAPSSSCGRRTTKDIVMADGRGDTMTMDVRGERRLSRLTQ